MALRRCLYCHRWALPGKSRCADHQRALQQAKDARRPQRRTHAAITTNAALVQAWVEQHGWWCPGIPTLRIAGHPSTDLTAEHGHPVAHGGDELTPTSVLCRSHNAMLGATVRRR